MLYLQLPGTFLLGLEITDKKNFRVVLFNENKEVACRKVSKPALLQFTQTNTSSIFKGRVQLEKNGKQVLVLLNKQPIGHINLNQLVNQIRKLDFLNPHESSTS